MIPIRERWMRAWQLVLNYRLKVTWRWIQNIISHNNVDTSSTAIPLTDSLRIMNTNRTQKARYKDKLIVFLKSISNSCVASWWWWVISRDAYKSQGRRRFRTSLWVAVRLNGIQESPPLRLPAPRKPSFPPPLSSRKLASQNCACEWRKILADRVVPNRWFTASVSSYSEGLCGCICKRLSATVCVYLFGAG